MTRPRLAVVHNNIDPHSSIGAIALWNVQEALQRDWDVVAVCRDLDPSLVGHVRHVPLYVPPRLHLVQWAAARATVKAALRAASYDVLLVHQPQLAAIADLWNVHYLSRAARAVRGPLPRGWRARVNDLQAAGVVRLEDHYLRRVPASTRVIFCSDVIRDDFSRLYGPPANATVIPNPALISPVPEDRSLPDRALRSSLVGDHAGPVVGFLGGGDPRKGGDLLVTAVAAEPDLFLLHAGSRGLDTSDPRLGGRTHDLGYLADVSTLLDAVDVLVVPSRFEPFGLVVTEAAARGVPVLVSPAVGAASLAVSAGAGAVWDPVTPLGPAVRDLLAHREQASAGGRALARQLSPAVLGERLFQEIEAIRARRAGRDRPGPGVAGAAPQAASPRSVAVLSLERWDEIWRRNQHLASRLVTSGAATSLTFITPPTPGLRLRAERWSPMPGVTVVTPPLLIPRRYGGHAALGAWIRRKTARADALWVNDPVAGAALRPGTRPITYDVTDDWRSLPQPAGDLRRIVEAEDRLAHTARTVVCSPVLQQRWRERYGIEATLVPNGVDVAAIRDAPRKALPGAAPHAVYVGTLHENRIDVALLIELAERWPGTLHLVGPNSLDHRVLERLARLGVDVVGPVASAEVPSWLASADVLVCPHRVDDFTLSLDAIKAYEYLATDRPVVATPTSGFQSMTAPGLVVAPAASFVDAAVAALDLGPVTRTAAADWHDRAAAFAAVLMTSAT